MVAGGVSIAHHVSGNEDSHHATCSQIPMVVVDEGSGKLEKLFGKYFRFTP